MIYYEELENGDIGRYTNSDKIAQKYGWTGQTDAEPVMHNGKLYLQADFERLDKTPKIEELISAKLHEIDEMTKQHITGGFTSAAKGTAHIYDSAEVDQLTFSAMYAASKSPDFEATEPYYGQIPIRAVPADENKKAIVKHNAVEMQKVIDDLALHIGKCKQIGWRLQEQAKAAKNQSDLDKIVRPS